MSAESQPDSTSAAQDALQARLDHLFRHHPREDAAGNATAVLRRYIEHYRRQGEQQAGGQA